jgi:hypothetical protein
MYFIESANIMFRSRGTHIHRRSPHYFVVNSEPIGCIFDVFSVQQEQKIFDE